MSSNRDEFGRIVAKMAVAQICESVGFHSVQASAIEALADVAIRYLRDLAKAAHFYSNLASRIESNAFDVILAMEDVGPVGGAAEPGRPLARSAALREVMRFVEYSDEIPFARPLPRFPVPKRRLAAPSFAQLGEVPPGSHIPSWLPALPDPHTYRATPVWPDRRREPAANRVEQARQRRKAESSLVALHSRLSATASMISRCEREAAPPPPRATTIDESAASGGANLFLAPPLAAGVRDVATIAYGGFKDEDGDRDGEVAPSIVDAFAPLVEAANGGGGGGVEIQDGGGAAENGLALVEQRVVAVAPPLAAKLLDSNRSQRVVLSFDFGGKAGTKGASANRILGSSRRQQSLKRQKSMAGGVDDDKDERKRRAELILSQGMDSMAAS